MRRNVGAREHARYGSLSGLCRHYSIQFPGAGVFRSGLGLLRMRMTAMNILRRPPDPTVS